MKQRLIICAAESRSQANRLVGHLINGGFAHDTVSILLAGENGSQTSIRKDRLHAASAMAAKAGVGALLGGAFAWLSGLGVLSMPGFGPLIIAGAPLVTAMSRSARGGMADALGSMGLSLAEAGFYENRVRQGHILVSINVSGNMEATAAKRIVRAIGLPDVADTGDKTISSASQNLKTVGEPCWNTAPAIAEACLKVQLETQI